MDDKAYAGTIFVCVAVFVSASAIGLAQLYFAHPAEDAFILFKYAENLARGRGVVYFAGGPRTEGATDFLWLGILSASVAAGIDVALAALLWNALGAALAAGILAREIGRSGAPKSWRILLFLAPLSIPFVAGAPAAYLGFSSLLYQALALVVFLAATEDSGRYVLLVPWLALTLTLFRPDGAFFAAVFVGAAAVDASRRHRTRAFVSSTAAAGFLGIAYFLGRWSYFGELLPLPLYVKSHGVLRGPVADRIRQYMPWLKGIGVQLMWLKSAIGPVPVLAALAIVAAAPPALGEQARPMRHLAIVAALACGVFLAALSAAFQVQNVHFRYQAPVTLLLIFLLTALASRRIALGASPIGRAALLAVTLAPSFLMIIGGARAIAGSIVSGRSYIDVLPSLLATVLHPGRTIALTDAGRLAYWTDTPTIDVAGLNYAPTALRPPSVELLRAIDPDVLLIHPGAAIVGEGFPAGVGDAGYFEIDPAEIERRIAPPYRSVFEHGLERYGVSSNTATVAAAVMLRYLVGQGGEYRIEAVRYQGGYRHLFAFRRSLPEGPAILHALTEATSGREYASYAALKRFPFARRFDAAVDRSEQ
jgi:hypothetical protein